jgi:glycosyltransferase involved in cell wall biosynthesis
MGEPLVSVIIPVRDDPLVFRAVESVLAQELPGGDFEVIVVDNGSKAAFRDSLRRLEPRVRVLDEPVQGAGATRNRGLDAASGDVVFFLDADCVALPGWLRAGVEGLETTGADMIVGARTPDAMTRSQRLARASWWRKPARPALSGRASAAPVERPFNIDTANAAVRRAVFGQVRFDTRLIRGEDWAFSVAAVRAGFRQAMWDAMQVQVSPDERFALKVAKELVAGWCMTDFNARLPAGPSRRRRNRARRRSPRFLRAKARLTIAAAWLLDGLAQVIPPERLAGQARALVQSGSGTGGQMFDAGMPLPSPFELVRGRIQSPQGHAPRPGDATSGPFDAVR